MLPQDVWLRTEWLSCHRNSVLRCVERYSAAAASEYRRALRKVQEVEETMAQVGTETGPHGTASQPAARLQSGEVEALNRRLSAANAEIRRYQTRLFACEREVVALRQENAELEALCDQARKNELLPPKTPQPPVLDQPGLPDCVPRPGRAGNGAPGSGSAEHPRPAGGRACTGSQSCRSTRTGRSAGISLCTKGLETHHPARLPFGGHRASAGSADGIIQNTKTTGNALRFRSSFVVSVILRCWSGVP